MLFMDVIKCEECISVLKMDSWWTPVAVNFPIGTALTCFVATCSRQRLLASIFQLPSTSLLNVMSTTGFRMMNIVHNTARISIFQFTHHFNERSELGLFKFICSPIMCIFWRKVSLLLINVWKMYKTSHLSLYILC